MEASHGSLALPSPCLMLITERMGRDRLIGIVREAVAGGVNAVQLRDKTATAEDLARTAAVLRNHLPDTLLLLNGWASRECGVGANGVHLPENGPLIEMVRRDIGPWGLVGRSIHTVEAAMRAAGEGADYLIAGTIFKSRSHPDIKPAGIAFLRSVCAAVELPVLAIGGVTPENATDCMAAGTAGVAVLSAILHAADPRAAAAHYRASLDRRQEEQYGTAC